MFNNCHIELFSFRKLCHWQIRQIQTANESYWNCTNVQIPRTVQNGLSYLQTRFGSWLSRRLAGTGSLEFIAERFMASNLKFFTAQHVMASVLDRITAHTAFSLSGKVVIGPNRLWLVTSFKAEAADVTSSAYAQCLNRLNGGRSGFADRHQKERLSQRFSPTT